MYFTNDKPIVYKKNVQKFKIDQKKDELFNLLISTDSIDFILKKIKYSKMNNFEERKNEINGANFNKYNLLYKSKCINNNTYKKYVNGNKQNTLYKSTDFDNSKNKLKHLIKDVLQEIKAQNIKTYTYKNEFQNRLSSMEFKNNLSSSLNKYSNSRYKTKKSNANANLNNLINLCTKENLQKYSKIAKKGLCS